MAARILNIDTEVSCVETLQLNSISDTNTVYTDWNPNDESIFSTEIPILDPGFDGLDFTSIFFELWKIKNFRKKTEHRCLSRFRSQREGQPFLQEL
jgi:hypothetical protein